MKELFLFIFSYSLSLHILVKLIFLTVVLIELCRDVDLTEKLDYSSAVALLGFSLILAILRSFNVRNEAARVMVAAPLSAFFTTHILYLNLFKLDYGKSLYSLHDIFICS